MSNVKSIESIETDAYSPELPLIGSKTTYGYDRIILNFRQNTN